MYIHLVFYKKKKWSYAYIRDKMSFSYRKYTYVKYKQRKPTNETQSNVHPRYIHTGL